MIIENNYFRWKLVHWLFWPWRTRWWGFRSSPGQDFFLRISSSGLGCCCYFLLCYTTPAANEGGKLVYNFWHLLTYIVKIPYKTMYLADIALPLGQPRVLITVITLPSNVLLYLAKLVPIGSFLASGQLKTRFFWSRNQCFDFSRCFDFRP